MSVVTDIPTRDSLIGAEQLALLRSYLKDTEVPNRFSDTLLIPLLINEDRVTVWRNLLGVPEAAVPFSYDESNPIGHINLIRSITGDTDELAISNTDYDLDRYLEVFPLKRLLQVIEAQSSEGSSTCEEDADNPIIIVRDLLNDEMGLTYTDKTIADKLLSKNIDPYCFILEVIDQKIGESAATTAQSSSSGLASIDGISFDKESAGSGSEGEVSNSREVIARLQVDSIYNKYPSSTYNSYVDGEEEVDTSRVGWYGL